MTEFIACAIVPQKLLETTISADEKGEKGKGGKCQGDDGIMN